MDDRGRLFGANFKGEDGVDFGGLYRDAVTRVVEDCFSPHFSLLVLCPNGRNDQAQNTDKYVPNPRHTSPRTLQMFEFLGKLIGLSMRQKLYLPFALPSIVWKQLVSEEVTLDDVRSIDETTAWFIATMKERAMTSKEVFDAEYLSNVFTITSAEGSPVELMPGGFDVPVTWETRDQYTRLAERFKVHEFDTQVSGVPLPASPVVLSGCLIRAVCVATYPPRMAVAHTTSGVCDPSWAGGGHP